MKLQSIKILERDIKRIESKRVHKTEPRWSIIERMLDFWDSYHDENKIKMDKNDKN